VCVLFALVQVCLAVFFVSETHWGYFSHYNVPEEP